MFRKVIVLVGTWALGWIVGFCPGIVGDIFTAYGRYRAELPADASPLAQRVYQQLANAEGWELKTEEGCSIVLRRGNSFVKVKPGNYVSVALGSAEMDSFTAREHGALSVRAVQVRDKILEMRRDALARDLFKDDGGGTQTVKAGAGKRPPAE